MYKTLVFIDDGFIAKLSKHFGNGKYIKFDKVLLAKNLAKRENLELKQLFYYTASPFQSPNPTREEASLKESYDSFKKKLSENKEVVFREGRIQRLKTSADNFIYKQKAVDTLIIIDLMSIPIKNKEIKKIIILASDSDLVPAIEHLDELEIKTILYTYYEKSRETKFSTSNELIKSVYKYVLLTDKDFYNALLIKNKEKD